MAATAATWRSWDGAARTSRGVTDMELMGYGVDARLVMDPDGPLARAW